MGVGFEEVEVVDELVMGVVFTAELDVVEYRDEEVVCAVVVAPGVHW